MHILKRGGVVLITIVDSDFYNNMFRFDELAEELRISQPVKHKFDPKDYPEYEHTITHQDESGIDDYSKIALIDSQKWNLDLKRRTQHYGYKYDYTARSVNASYYLGEMPYWIGELCSKLGSDRIFIEKPDQVIINEYMPGQGIASHIDCVPCFGGTICSLSLESGCVMDLSWGDIKRSNGKIGESKVRV